MNISLPDTLKSFLDEQVDQGGYGTSSEYVRELIRKDQDRLQLRDLLVAGAASAPAVPSDPPYFEGLRNRVRKGDQGWRPRIEPARPAFLAAGTLSLPRVLRRAQSTLMSGVCRTASATFRRGCRSPSPLILAQAKGILTGDSNMGGDCCGPSEVIGTPQTGLMEFRIAELSRGVFRILCDKNSSNDSPHELEVITPEVGSSQATLYGRTFSIPKKEYRFRQSLTVQFPGVQMIDLPQKM